MKKLLVFTLVVSMLAVAGVAFADDLNPHAAPTPDVPASNVPATSDVTSAVSTVTETQVTEVTSKYSAEIAVAQEQAKQSVTAATSVSTTQVSIIQTVFTTAKVITSTVASALTAPSASTVSSTFAKATAAIINAAAKKQSSTSNQPTVRSPAAVPSMSILDILRGLGIISAQVPYQQLTLKVSFDVAGMKEFEPNSFLFFPQSQSLDLVGAADDMRLVYINSGDTAPTALGVTNLASVDNDASVFLVMNYNGNPATGGLGTTSFDASSDALIKTLNPLIMAVSENTDSTKTVTVPETVVPSTPGSDDQPTTHTLGGSGGGCVAGTSVLALAVLGVFLAKRRG